jgi:hypothetical protein
VKNIFLPELFARIHLVLFPPSHNRILFCLINFASLHEPLYRAHPLTLFASPLARNVEIGEMGRNISQTLFIFIGKIFKFNAIILALKHVPINVFIERLSGSGGEKERLETRIALSLTPVKAR